MVFVAQRIAAGSDGLLLGKFRAGLDIENGLGDDLLLIDLVI